jgi:sensor domain CHASE-containing protein
MSLRSATTLILFFAFIVTIITIFFYFERVYFGEFEKLEDDNLTKQVQVIQNSFEQTIDKSVDFTSDWAEWTDSYRFMQSKNKAYIESNLVHSSLDSTDTDAILFIDLDFNHYYSIYRNHSSEAVLKIQEMIKESPEKFIQLIEDELYHAFFKTNSDGDVYLATVSFPLRRTVLN